MHAVKSSTYLVSASTYDATAKLGISGTVTLDGRTMRIASSSFKFLDAAVLCEQQRRSLKMANASNVVWQVGSPATLQTGATFSDTIMAAASVLLGTGATVNGRVLASNGAVTLLSNTVTVPQ